MMLMTSPAVAKPFWEQVGQDYWRFYTTNDNLLPLAGGFAVAGIMANTNIDQEFRDEYQEDWRSSGTDEYSDIVERFGDRPVLLLYAGLSLFDPDECESSMCRAPIEWGRRSMRSALVGLPTLLGAQYVLGAARPSDRVEDGSQWEPLDFNGSDTHAASGHAFVGALPFLSAAKMAEHWVTKSALYTTSTFTAWSRVNDDKHYLSQAILGWFIAYRAATVIDENNRQADSTLTWMPYTEGKAVGLAVNYRF